MEVVSLPQGSVWLDTGTLESLVAAATYVKVIEDRQGRKIGCPEEIAYLNGWIDKQHLKSYAQNHAGNPYSRYLTKVIS